jgi:hypothetical protein
MEPRIPKYVTFGNATVKLFTRLGIKTGPVNVITVAGRASGNSRPSSHWFADDGIGYWSRLCGRLTGLPGERGE